MTLRESAGKTLSTIIEIKSNFGNSGYLLCILRESGAAPSPKSNTFGELDYKTSSFIQLWSFGGLTRAFLRVRSVLLYGNLRAVWFSNKLTVSP